MKNVIIFLSLILSIKSSFSQDSRNDNASWSYYTLGDVFEGEDRYVVINGRDYTKTNSEFYFKYSTSSKEFGLYICLTDLISESNKDIINKGLAKISDEFFLTPESNIDLIKIGLSSLIERDYISLKWYFEDYEGNTEILTNKIRGLAVGDIEDEFCIRYKIPFNRGVDRTDGFNCMYTFIEKIANSRKIYLRINDYYNIEYEFDERYRKNNILNFNKVIGDDIEQGGDMLARCSFITKVQARLFGLQ